MLIKICGLRFPKDAVFAVENGANFIGIVFCKMSPRAVSIRQAQELASATKEVGGTPVAVFFDEDAERMHAICEATEIKTIQLHGSRPKVASTLMPEVYESVLACRVNETGDIMEEDRLLLETIPHEPRYVLYDSHQAGSGKPFNWEKFSPVSKTPYFLAGGLNPENVAEAIHHLQPVGVDVSSGVERERGVKDRDLIQKFITKVREKI